MIRLHVFGVLLGAGLVSFASGARASDAENGGVLAKRWCAACHVVSADQTRGNADAPTFASIGKRPNFDAEKTAQFLLTPHPIMPNMSLTRNETADLAAYIAAQAR